LEQCIAFSAAEIMVSQMQAAILANIFLAMVASGGCADVGVVLAKLQNLTQLNLIAKLA
jgi:hypothetical protein